MIQNAQMEVESTFNPAHLTVLSAVEMLTLLMTHQLVSAAVQLDTTMLLVETAETQAPLAASHVLPNSALHAHPQTLQDVLHAFLVPLWIPATFATVFQDTSNLMEHAKHAQPSAMVVKFQEFVQLAQILKEDSIKTVNAQLVSLMMAQQSARPATHSARLVPTLLLVHHASVKTTEASATDNVSAHQDSIKLLTLTTLPLAKNATLNVKNATVQTFA